VTITHDVRTYGDWPKDDTFCAKSGPHQHQGQFDQLQYVEQDSAYS
jgi:hypothetical protein